MSLPSLPSDFAGDFVATGNKPTPAVRRPIEPVGRFFLHHAQRQLRNHTWSEFEKIQATQNVKEIESSVDADELLFDEDIHDKSMLTCDPIDWKTCDLYDVMGLTKLRYRATQQQIIKAHRKQVLKHHPDKKSASGGLEQDGFFKIIQKAFETLTDATKKQQYDSCDFNADVLPPKKGDEYDFFEAWGPVFAAEGRFSKKQPVPELGSAEDTKEVVDKFYSFWFKFESWRTFEFLDEDVPDDSANRDNKRYIERKNKAARDKKKTADNSRLAKLVERAMSEDPRIKAFKEAEKAEKAKKKWEREAGARAEAEAKAKAEAEAKAKAEAEAKAAEEAKASGKKAKEAAKNAKKKNKRAIRGAAKDQDYFGDAADATKIDEQLGLIVDSLNDDQLASVAAQITGDAAAVKAALVAIAKELVDAGKLPASTVSYFA